MCLDMRAPPPVEAVTANVATDGCNPVFPALDALCFPCSR